VGDTKGPIDDSIEQRDDERVDEQGEKTPE
jgi:hypothetical protein